jgi:hypothetical protein
LTFVDYLIEPKVSYPIKLAADLAGGGVIQQGRLFRELLVQSKAYGE